MPLQASDAKPLKPVAIRQVAFADRFWRPRQEVNRTALIPHAYRMCEQTGRIDAFRLQWRPGMTPVPHIFWDSDVAKWLEAAAYTLAAHPDPALEAQADALIDLMAKAQQADGYLNTHFTAVEPDKRWTNLRDAHELYCAGHLIEAAVAYAESTGKRRLLDVMSRYVDLMDATFGTEPGRKRGYGGHPEIELALVRLYRATGTERYLRLARYFVDERGRQPYYFDIEAQARQDARLSDDPRRHEYYQAHQPLREQSEVVGHAVRAFYLYSGMADVAALCGDAGLLAACRRLWDDATLRKLYVTGGVGPSRHNEGFTNEFDLPNETAYAETCAAIALVFFGHRMLQIEADGRYADVMERALYNGVLSGMSLDGCRFFYANPLASDGPPPNQPLVQTAGGGHTCGRVEWFGCACCPPNLSRLLASLGQYVCSTAPAAVYVHLFAASDIEAEVAGQAVRLKMRTAYPWAGDIRIAVEPERAARFDLMLRIPGWCAKHRVEVNGRPAVTVVVKGYARIRRTWQPGDAVTLSLAMPVERVVAHPHVAADLGKVAIQRGPLVYCLEACDNPEVRSMLLPRHARLTARFDTRTLGGMAVIEGRALCVSRKGWQRRLYAGVAGQDVKTVRLKAIPYFAWSNRQPGAMRVWLPESAR